jgi:diaminopimelate epimerase
MSGSGNDFIFFDARLEPPGRLAESPEISRMCARATGIGADGVVFLQNDPQQQFRIRYFNQDGSLGKLCGNASLCTTRLAVELGLAKQEGFQFETDAGVISARLSDGVPEIDTPTVANLRENTGIDLEPGEVRIGFADTGVPHLVVLVEDTDAVDVVERGRFLRHHRSLKAGANVNFVALGANGQWRMRTFERGVEGETLACGTGAVATGVLLEAWGLNGAETAIETRSGAILTVTIRHVDGAIKPSLRGEGRIVFHGELGEV